MKKKRTKTINGEFVRSVRRFPFPRPDYWLVLSWSPHCRGTWDVSNPKTSERAAMELIERNDLAHAVVVKVNGEGTR